MRGDVNRADLLSPPPLLSVEDLDRQRFLDDLYGQIAQVAAQIAGARASLKALQTKQDRALKEARDPSISAATLHEEAEGLSKREAECVAQLRPVLDHLKGISEKYAAKAEPDTIDRAIQRYAEETIDIAISWLELIQNYRLGCLRLASEKGNAQSIISSADELEREFSTLMRNEEG